MGSLVSASNTVISISIPSSPLFFLLQRSQTTSIVSYHCHLLDAHLTIPHLKIVQKLRCRPYLLLDSSDLHDRQHMHQKFLKRRKREREKPSFPRELSTTTAVALASCTACSGATPASASNCDFPPRYISTHSRDHCVQYSHTPIISSRHL